MSCCHLLLSGFLFQESKKLSLLRPVSVLTMRECRGENIWEQSGNKSSSHVLSRAISRVLISLHGFIVNRSDVAFRLTFCSVCSIFDNALGFILVIDTSKSEGQTGTLNHGFMP
ncbi:Uncharacterised protein [Escherichia coli]|uniref:Uncharacterized protein n=1 Tax=Escherichia coli TaxID=562 RepID=A0A2X1K879_ECOLX|nr:Uncharacterised protein [Escherichia coli]